MEAFINPHRETTAHPSRIGKVSKTLPDDYALYVTSCNEKMILTGDKTCMALPEHLWRGAPIKN